MSKLKIMPNPDGEVYKKMTDAVKNNQGYCPCMVEKTNDTKCICKDFNEQSDEGACHCGRYVKILI